MSLVRRNVRRVSAEVACAAVDLGATSGRVVVGRWRAGRLQCQEVHRFANGFRALGGHDYWDVAWLWSEIAKGLQAAAAAVPRLHSVGVDTWGVDHVLVGREGRLAYPVHCYRDARTQPGLKAQQGSGAERAYRRTGIPALFYNTSLQLRETVLTHPGITRVADRVLLLPEYFNFLLSGQAVHEVSIASTTQLLSTRGLSWSQAQLAEYGLPRRWFGPVERAGKVLGSARNVNGLERTQVVLVPGHDTACAFAAMPAAAGDLLLSTGTWSLAGCESETPWLGAEAQRLRVSNERMGHGGFRPLATITGLWLVERVLHELGVRPRTAEEWRQLLTEAAQAEAPALVVPVNAPELSNPSTMLGALGGLVKREGGRAPRTRGGWLRLVVESLAEGHAQAARSLAGLRGEPLTGICMVGGGARNPLLVAATAKAAGLPVLAGEVEGAVWGNLGQQLVALGAWPDLGYLREAVRSHHALTRYEPDGTRNCCS